MEIESNSIENPIEKFPVPASKPPKVSIKKSQAKIDKEEKKNEVACVQNNSGTK